MNLSFQTERPLRAGNNIWGRNEGTQERYRSVPKKQFFKKEGWEWGGGAGRNRESGSDSKGLQGSRNKKGVSTQQHS